MLFYLLFKPLKTVLAIMLMGLLFFLNSFEEKRKVKVWVEKDGIIIVEAEHFQREIQDKVDDFVVKDSPNGFSGTGYVRWEGSGDWKNEVPYDSFPKNRSLRYHFKINNPGIYLAKIRNYHLEEDGDNDVYLSINKSTWNKIYDHQVKQFSWDENGKWKDSYPQHFEEGVYLLEIAGRSVGFGVDKITLFKEEYYPEPLNNHKSQPWFAKEESVSIWLEHKSE